MFEVDEPVWQIDPPPWSCAWCNGWFDTVKHVDLEIIERYDEPMSTRLCPICMAKVRRSVERDEAEFHLTPPEVPAAADAESIGEAELWHPLYGRIGTEPVYWPKDWLPDQGGNDDGTRNAA